MYKQHKPLLDCVVFYLGFIMIAYIKGQIIHIESNNVTIENQGIGYQVFLIKHDLSNQRIGNYSSFFIHTYFKEDSIELYGFSNPEQKEIFLLLTTINGIGKKTALNILSNILINDLINAIAVKNITLLASLPGIGKKTAERIALELKDKLEKFIINNKFIIQESQKTNNLQNAINNLGFSKEQTQKALISLTNEEIETHDLEFLVKKCLNILTGNKLL